jgi:hypothetical protein
MHFVHILITDGQDTSLQQTLQQAAYAMSVSVRFPVSRCKTEIIEIDLEENPQATAELMLLDQLGLENCRVSEIN